MTDLLVRLDRKAQLDHKDRKARLDHKEPLELPELKACRELLALLVLKVLKAP